MSRIIERALSIINDNLKDQTSSFADPISIKPMARGGRLLEDDYPTHYMPHIGRQVMALGGEPEPVNKALDVAQEMPQTPLPDLRPTPVAPSIPSAEGRVVAKAPKLQKTFELENRPSTIVSPRPGKGYGPAIVPEPGVKYEDPEYTGFGERGEEPSSYQEFSYATPDIGGMKLPPPIQHPVLNTPRMDRIAAGTAKIFKSKGFQDLIEDHVGLDPKKLKVTPTVGLFRGELEPSFYIDHPDMQPEHAKKLGHLLGFGFQQDQAVETNHNSNINDGTLTALIGHGRKLSSQDIDNIAKAANDEKVDFSITKDGKAAKFLHFGNDAEYPEFLDKVGRIADLNKLKERYHARAEGSLINAQDYLPGIFGGSSGVERVQEGAARSPYLFGRIVDHVLAPFAKVTAGEGYRLSPERLQSAYGLTDDEAEKVRTALLPTKKGDRTTIPLMTGEEQLDVRPTGHRGKTSVDDVQFALQNRATEKGQIDPGDYSDEAKKILANDIAREVKYHVDNSQKSAVGWYDAALKKAKGLYHQIFPEIKTNKDNELLFDALLGITSQGNDVYNNSVHAARLYNKIRDGMSLKEATQSLKGSFGSQTRAIEQNLNKFHHLIETNGYDRMRDLFNQTKTVSEWKKILNSDPTLRGPNGEKLSVKGSADQKITGWSVFGPKIGSFINNLHGDYSTLTADLWFSRTWNRLLGHNFIHSPLAEQKQYQDFRDAFKQEFLHNNGFPFERMPLGLHALENGQPKYEKGEPVPWEHGEDTKGMTYGEFEEIYNDPDKLLNYAQDLYKKYSTATKGVPAFSVKSDLRRRAKNWAENRELSEAAPRGDRERNFQQETVEEAQKLLKKKGLNISIADIQAALWFHEKELFNKLGVATERAKPADYEDAARKTMELVKNNKLYHVKSREESADKEEGADQEDKIEKAYGGAITPGPRLTEENADDFARRLILWSYATAPLFHKAEGGAVDPAAKAVDTAREMTEGRQLNPMGFYSAAAEAASKFPQKAPIDQIINKIKGQPNVKKEELDNANLADAFAGQRSVDPQEVARHLQENIPNIKERVYGGSPAVKYEPKALLERPEGFENSDDVYEVGPQGKPPHLIAVNGNNFDVWGPSGYHDSFDSLSDAVEYANQSIYNIEPPLYGEYTIPGGKNYREVVMALPHHQGAMKTKFRVTGALPDSFDSREEAENYIQQMQQMGERNPGVAKKLAQFPMDIIAETKPVSEPYKSSHWRGIPNPLAHLRMSDRDNGKTLHLEELQSDWGQEGRKKGFYDPNREKTDSILTQMSRDVSQQVPSAPYVTDTNQWVDLGLKRALMEAAKGGYDKLVWTPGAEQADRYKLSNRISTISWNPETTILMAHNLNGDEVLRKKTSAEEMPDVIGKDLAHKLINSEPYKTGPLTSLHSIAGGDLEVGGEGMKAFYDKLVPQRLSKLVSQYDKDAKIALHSHLLTGKNGEVEAHSIKITPKLREAILKGGLPAFEKGGSVIDAAFDVLSKLRR